MTKAMKPSVYIATGALLSALPWMLVSIVALRPTANPTPPERVVMVCDQNNRLMRKGHEWFSMRKVYGGAYPWRDEHEFSSSRAGMAWCKDLKAKEKKDVR